MTNTNITYRESVLLNIAEKYCLFPSEAAMLGAILKSMKGKLSMSESEVLWHLSTNEELASYAASVARDVALTHGASA